MAAVTTFYERPFPESVQDAPLIVRGQIGMSYTDWGKAGEGPKRIYTFYELKVDEVFKGELPGLSIIMRELGGEKDGVGMQIAGTAQFSRGEDVVVFLSAPPSSDGSYELRGMMMAKFNIRRDEKGREQLIGPGITGAGEHGHSHAGDEVTAKSFTIEDLRQIVKDQGAETRAQVTPAPPLSPSPIATLAQPQHQANGSEVRTAVPSELADLDTIPARAPVGVWLGALLILGVAMLWMLRRRRG